MMPLSNGSRAVPISTLLHNNTLPNIWLEVDVLAKIMYSTILTDLGQGTGPNLLLSPSALQHFAVSPSCAGGQCPLSSAFDPLDKETALLGTSPAVISSKYLCTVPRRKSAGSLVLSLFIANVVFIQAMWKIFHFLLELVVEKRDREGERTFAVRRC